MRIQYETEEQVVDVEFDNPLVTKDEVGKVGLALGTGAHRGHLYVAGDRVWNRHSTGTLSDTGKPEPREVGTVRATRIRTSLLITLRAQAGQALGVLRKTSGHNDGDHMASLATLIDSLEQTVAELRSHAP